MNMIMHSKQLLMIDHLNTNILMATRCGARLTVPLAHIKSITTSMSSSKH